MNHYRFEELLEGLADRFEVLVTAGDIQRFAELSGDVSPVHVDDDFARSRGFPGRIAHGALLTAYVSRFVGVLMPGSGGVLQRVEMEFRHPCFAGDRLIVAGEVFRRVEALEVVILKVTIVNAATGELLANGKVQSGLKQSQQSPVFRRAG